MFCPSFVQDSPLIIDNMMRVAVGLFTVLMIHSVVADPQVNILLLFLKIGINKPKLKNRYLSDVLWGVAFQFIIFLHYFYNSISRKMITIILYKVQKKNSFALVRSFGAVCISSKWKHAKLHVCAAPNWLTILPSDPDRKKRGCSFFLLR